MNAVQSRCSRVHRGAADWGIKMMKRIYQKKIVYCKILKDFQVISLTSYNIKADYVFIWITSAYTFCRFNFDMLVLS